MNGVRRVAVLIGCSLILFLNEAAAQSILLDADLKAGYQGANVVRPLSDGDRIDVEVVAKDIAGADGFSLILNYDEALLAFSSFSSGPGIPGLTGLTLPGTAGAIEVGGASLNGAAEAGTLQLGTVTFVVVGSIGSTDITVGAASINVGGTETSAAQTAGIALQTSPAQIVLDGNAASGQQGATVIDDVVAGETVLIELIGSGLAGISGFSATLIYDGGLVFDGYTAGDVIPGMTGLQLTGIGQVEIGGASVTGSATVSSGRLAVARFVVGPGFGGEATIRLDGGKFSDGSGETPLELAGAISVRGAAAGKTPDFDGSGLVDFTDFLTFAAGFGKVLGDPDYNPALDLDQDGAVGFGDFLQFAAVFGTSGAGKPALQPQRSSGPGEAYLTVRSQDAQIHVLLSIEDITQFRGYGAEITYDPSAVRFVSAERALDGPMATSEFPFVLVQETSPGQLMIADAMTLGAATGSGEVVHLVFDRIGGSPRVELDLVQVLDGSGAHRIADLGVYSDDTLRLSQNIPNPFNPQTQIAYVTPEDGRVNLTVYSETGQTIAILVDQSQRSGSHRVVWDGRDAQGRDVASGVYVYKLTATNEQIVRKMVLLR